MFFSNKSLVAIDIGTSNIKLAEVDFASRGPVLKKFGIVPLTYGTIVNGEIMDIESIAHAIESLTGSTKTKRNKAITGLWGVAVIVKKISMPRIEASLVAEQLKWEAEQYIPFDINEISLEHHILKTHSAPENMDVLLVAAKQDILFKFMECIEFAKLKCAVMDVSGFALANCFEVNYGRTDQPVALMNIGGGVINFVVVEKGEVTFSRDIPIGGANFTSEIAKSMNISFQEAEAMKLSASRGQEVPDEVNGIIKATVDQVIEEIRSSFELFGATSGGTAISKVYLTGGSIFVPGLVDQLAAVVGGQLEVMDPFLKIQYDTKVFTAEYIDQIKAISSVTLGLALRKLGD
jgi:type IV pilus assembly protein PilM